MSALLAPLLAQLITLGVADRTEARYQNPAENRYEGSTRPTVRLSLAWPRFSATFGYGASFTLTPLESTPRDLLVYHNASVGLGYTYRRTSISVSSSASYGQVNFRTQVLADASAQRPQDGTTTNGNGMSGTANGNNTGGSATPKPDPARPAQPGAVPGVATGGLQQYFIVDRPVRYGSLANTITVNHQVDKALRLGANASYVISGGLNDDATEAYPWTRGTAVGLFGGYVVPWTAANTFSTAITLQQAWSSSGHRVSSAVGNENWSHRFTPHTSSTLGAGVSISRVPFRQDYSAISVFPTFTAALLHTTRLARGTLTLSLGAYSAPALDPLRATVDPRLGASTSAGWALKRFSARVGASAAVSIADSNNNAGALDNKTASAGIAYRIASFLQADIGASVAEQAYQGVTTVPLSYSAFVGLTFATEAPLNGKKR